MPLIWMDNRGRRESGHALGFLFELLGFSALLMSVLVDAPRKRA